MEHVGADDVMEVAHERLAEVVYTNIQKQNWNVRDEVNQILVVQREPEV